MQGNRLFFTRRDPENEQMVLYVRIGDAAPRVLIDPSALGSGAPVSLDWWYPSEDGLLLAYGLSEGGSEMSTLHVMDVDSGGDMRDEIPWARAAGVAWEPDGNGFYYSRFPAPGDVPEGEEFYHRKIYYHMLSNDTTPTGWCSAKGSTSATGPRRRSPRTAGSSSRTCGWAARGTTST